MAQAERVFPPILAVFLLLCSGLAVLAQDMTRYLDLKSDDFTKAEMTRADVEAAIAAPGAGGRADLTGKRLNGLDLSGLRLRGAALDGARLNGANLSHADLEGASLDRIWALKANFTGANLRKASLFSAQLMGAVLDGADLSEARAPANFTRASLKGARLDGADLSADMTNQSMGLMRGVLQNANLDKASLVDAKLGRVVFEFASLRGADLTGADLTGAELAGADLTGATVAKADFTRAALTGAQLADLKARAEAIALP